MRPVGGVCGCAVPEKEETDETDEAEATAIEVDGLGTVGRGD